MIIRFFVERIQDMLDLNITIDRNSGFCFGVVYAVEMAEHLLEENNKLFCLGDIVHNDEEVRRLQNKGLEIISHEDLRSLRDTRVLIRAHGEPASTYQLAMTNNLELIDASCPVVLKLQNRIKNSFDKSENIYIYGKHGHAEVIGLLGQTGGSAVVFQDIKELKKESLPKEITLYSQTTKSKDSFYKIIAELNEWGITVNVNDTICRQVSNRNRELRDFAKTYDKIIFVSGTKSSNGKVLFKICQENNQHSYFVSDKTQLRKEWFGLSDKVGICGATSTPMWLMEDVKYALSKI